MLHAVDRLEILVVVDNYADTLLGSSPGVARFRIGEDGRLASDTLLAEHGLCLLLRAEWDGQRVSVMLDAGYSPIAAPRNLDLMGETTNELSGLVISHGHEDHVGAALSVLERAGRPPLVAHPGAFHVPRYWSADDGTLYRVPELLRRDDLERRGIRIIESLEPTEIGGGAFLVTGEIPRATSFEQALPGSIQEVDGELVPDKISDDQAVIVDVRGHGLVVISGCAHAGIVNTVHHARKLTGMRPVYAVVGGFHLSGAPFRDSIEPTIEALREEHPSRIVPMHCTGVDAMTRMRHTLGDVCAVSAVGTRFSFPFQR